MGAEYLCIVLILEGRWVNRQVAQGKRTQGSGSQGSQAAQNAGALGWRLEAAELDALDQESARLP